ncbi:MAG: dihydroneopterin aldolase [Bacteroides sp.]|nr:dihydroneopterin aldolase [Bacteroides sp.]
MRATDMFIQMKGIQLYAFHGVLPQETAVGANFYIDLKLKTDFSHAAQTDKLEGTVSYAEVYEAVKEEMQIPSKLLEHVCQRIAGRIFRDFPTVEALDIELTKENPPMGACGKSIGVSAHYDR